MAVMNSMAAWSSGAGSDELGRRWRDAATRRMAATVRYVPYEDLVRDAAAEVDLPATATSALLERWSAMKPWPDAAAIERLSVPYAFVTNCSSELARVAARRSGLRPAFVLAAEEAARYKPNASMYREACGRLGTPPARTAFVAGSPYDARGAAAAGLQAWLVVRRSDLPDPGPPVRLASSLEAVVADLTSPDSRPDRAPLDP
jgi:2-haloalkanoic acid dehalogenase type II